MEAGLHNYWFLYLSYTIDKIIKPPTCLCNPPKYQSNLTYYGVDQKAFGVSPWRDGGSFNGFWRLISIVLSCCWVCFGVGKVSCPPNGRFLDRFPIPVTCLFLVWTAALTVLKGQIRSATMFSWLECVKEVSRWMPGHKASQHSALKYSAWSGLQWL